MHDRVLHETSAKSDVKLLESVKKELLACNYVLVLGKWGRVQLIRSNGVR